MTFEQYKQGVKDVMSKDKSYLALALYNSNVNDKCDFKVSIGEFVSKLEQTIKQPNSKVDLEITLTPGYSKENLNQNFKGVVYVGVTYNSLDSYKPVMVELAKFPVNCDTLLVDGTTLKSNIYIEDDYGRKRIRLMPDVDVRDFIVKLDLTEEYMTYTQVLKALFNCDIIENSQTDTFTK